MYQERESRDSDLNYTEGDYSENAYERSRYGAYGSGSYAGGPGTGTGGSYAGGAGTGAGGSYAGGAGTGSNGAYDGGPERRRRGGKTLARRAAGIVAAGVLFGCVAGGTMAGVHVAADRLLPQPAQAESEAEQIAQAETAAQQTESTADAVPVSTGNDVSAIVDKAMPSVVAINNTMIYTQQNWFFGEQQYEVPSSGSGIIVGQNDDELLIVTNNHVVEDSEEMSVTFIDGTSVAAAIKGTDSNSDLAVIAVQIQDIPQETKDEITVAQLGDSDSLKLGQGVVAIGNALGQGQSVTVGYVSALNKKVTIDGVERTLLQVDAAINPGNSGGALLNMQGEVIGINAAKYADTDVEGVGYAIPISEAKEIIDDLMTRTTKIEVAEDEQGYLGIQLQNIDSRMAQAFGMPEGIYVYKIVEGGAAAGSELRERDIITEFDGERVRTGEELQRLLTYYKGGTTVTLTVQRLEDGSYVEKEVSVTLGYRADSDSAQETQDGE